MQILCRQGFIAIPCFCVTKACVKTKRILDGKAVFVNDRAKYNDKCKVSSTFAPADCVQDVWRAVAAVQALPHVLDDSKRHAISKRNAFLRMPYGFPEPIQTQETLFWPEKGLIDKVTHLSLEHVG